MAEQPSPGMPAAPADTPAGVHARHRGRPKNDPAVKTSAEQDILARMRRIDQGQGCHATVQNIGISITPGCQSFSKSQTRRHIRRLRELGEICFLGLTPKGRSIYVLPGKTYRDKTIIPLCPSRPVDHLKRLPGGESWSTDKAREVLGRVRDLPEPVSMTAIDGFPVNEQLRKSYSLPLLQRAIAALKKQYDGSGIPIHNPAGLLKIFIAKEIEGEKSRRDAAFAMIVAGCRHQPGDAAPTEPEAPAAPEAVGKRVLELMRTGRFAEVESLVQQYGTPSQSSPASAGPTVKTILSRFVERKQGGATTTAPSFHRSKANQLDRWLGPKLVAELTHADLADYKRRRRSEHVCEGTIKAELKVLRQALREAAAAGLITVRVAAALMPGLRSDLHRAVPRSRGDP